MNIFAGVLLGVALIGGLALQVAGAVIARRAWRRYGWDELRLVYRGFLWWLILWVASAAALPLFGYAMSEFGSKFGIAYQIGAGNSVVLLSKLFGIAMGLTTVVIAVGMYRLARRGAGVR
jgi:hypothetical protein